MSWSVIIAAILEYLKPVLEVLGKRLAELISEWLDNLFTRQSKKLAATGNDETDTEILLKASLDATPRVRVFKRAFLRGLLDHAQPIAARAKMSKAAAAELLALAKPASKE